MNLQGGKMFTPLEERVLNAQALSAGLAATVIVQDLIRKGEEAHIGVCDLSLPNEVRAEAIKESREVNDTFALIASVQALSGIGA
jgi:hypothetical protein|tara:strand:- start:199 stop:453 length:255 start_codon:yes stop_codon:yes gene_type:complete